MSNAPKAMPRYVCNRKVHALRIVDVARVPIDRASAVCAWLLQPADQAYEPIMVSSEWFNKYKPLEDADGCYGYYLLHEDGYESYVPAMVFLKDYTPL